MAYACTRDGVTRHVATKGRAEELARRGYEVPDLAPAEEPKPRRPRSKSKPKPEAEAPASE